MEEKAKEFVDAYNKLVEEHELQLIAVPSLKPRDDGSFSIVVNMQVMTVKKD